jgi:hypothetical protein
MGTGVWGTWMEIWASSPTSAAAPVTRAMFAVRVFDTRSAKTGRRGDRTAAVDMDVSWLWKVSSL